MRAPCVQHLGGGRRQRMLFLTGRRTPPGRGKGHQIKTGNELFCLQSVSTLLAERQATTIGRFCLCHHIMNEEINI